MSDTAAVPLVVVSSSRDPVEALNSLLRRHGFPVHCTWIPSVQDLPDALVQLNPEMLICVTTNGAELPLVTKVRDATVKEIPLLVIRPQITEEIIAADMALGARDSTTLNSLAHVHAVFARELKVSRMERALQNTLRAVQDNRKQLETVLTRSHDAIAQVQDGILVGANRSWLELTGAADMDAVIGQPVMDCFDETNHAALKGALTACQQGRWNDQALRASLQTADGSQLSLELVLTLGERDGEPCVHLIIPTHRRSSDNVAEELAEAVRRNPRSGLLYRQPLLESMQKRITVAVPGGSRYLLSIRPDNYAKLERELGVFRGEDFIIALATLVRTQLAPSDLLGHFSGAGMMALIERGTARDAELWAERLVEKIARHEFDIGSRKVKATVCIGLSAVSNSEGKLESTISAALEAVDGGRQRGGNQVAIVTPKDTGAGTQSYDAVWVKHIRAALTENRFRLVQQPIASLAGGDEPMFDMLVRMLDKQGKEVLPSEFVPAAERNDLASHIDRWVIMATVRFAVRTKPGCLFVRLSRSSAVDQTLAPWIDAQVRTAGLEPHRLCIQVSEDIAARHPVEVRQLARKLKEFRLRFALEHFGAGIDPLGLLNVLPLDFVKIDGSLMQGLMDDELLQSKVSSLVDAARAKDIETIAERVEDANTMAVLWQLGVQHLQGFLIRAPEEVVMSSPEISATQQQRVIQVLNESTRSTFR